MLPVKMEITNFKGLRGRRTIEFARSFMTYCLPNAAGKTSLFDAFRWGLTGLEPEGEMVTKGEPGCRVDLFWEDGTITSRRRSMKTGTTNCYINGADLHVPGCSREPVTGQILGVHPRAYPYPPDGQAGRGRRGCGPPDAGDHRGVFR